MKENVLDVLMYLFENYMVEEPEFEKDHQTLTAELFQAGFEHRDINKAFDWLQDLSEMCDPAFPPPMSIGRKSIRHYAAEETRRLNAETRGFLLSLEQSGVLDAPTREVVIDRVMALEVDEIDLNHIKWVTMMVLCNQPGQEDMYVWMEDVVLNGVKAKLQ